MAVEESGAAEKDRLREKLLKWYGSNKRDLPWRHRDEPYAVWVAEIMLQQTQVSTVIEYFEDWMSRFPDVESLADASRDEVLEMWEGLGFYRRAKYLHESSRKVVDEYEGELPSDADELQNLKGIGPYTAGAIASIAFGREAPLVDGNVRRVLGRLFELKGDPDTSGVEDIFWEKAEKLIEGEHPGDFNQALMELGAMICTPNSPSCMLCPVRDHCRAFEEGAVEDYPVSSKRSKQKPVTVATSVVRRRDSEEFLVIRRDHSELLSGLWEFPAVEGDYETGEVGGAIDEFLAEHLDVDFSLIEKNVVGSRVHHFSHLRMTLLIEERLLDIDARDCHKSFETADGRAARWVDRAELEDVAMSMAMRKVQRAFEDERSET